MLKRAWFSSSPRSFFPRVSTQTATSNLTHISPITGSTDEGVHRFDHDFLETCEWVNTLITAMSDENSIKKLIRTGKDTTRSETRPICIETHHAFTYDFTVPSSHLNTATLHVAFPGAFAASALSSLTPSQIASLKLILGPAFSSVTNTMSLTSSRDQSTHSQNIKILAKVYSDLIASVKSGEHEKVLGEVERVGGGFKREKPSLVFPDAWREEAIRVGKEEEAHLELLKTLE